MRENTKLIMEDLNFKELNNTDISICMELSYTIGRNEHVDKLNTIISNYSVDGMYTFSVFVLYCYKEYCKGEFWSIYELLDEKLEELIENFIKKYFVGE